MIMLGVIGEYLGRIYIETKARPHFLIRESSAGEGLSVTTAVGRDRLPLERQETAPRTTSWIGEHSRPEWH
jgi:hypothetical protein